MSISPGVIRLFAFLLVVGAALTAGVMATSLGGDGKAAAQPTCGSGEHLERYTVIDYERPGARGDKIGGPYVYYHTKDAWRCVQVTAYDPKTTGTHKVKWGNPGCRTATGTEACDGSRRDTSDPKYAGLEPSDYHTRNEPGVVGPPGGTTPAVTTTTTPTVGGGTPSGNIGNGNSGSGGAAAASGAARDATGKSCDSILSQGSRWSHWGYTDDGRCVFNLNAAPQSRNQYAVFEPVGLRVWSFFSGLQEGWTEVEET